MDEAKTIERCLAGDVDAFGLIVREHPQKAYSIALNFFRQPDEAKDAVQVAFLKAYRSLSRLNTRKSFFAWYARILLNHCVDVSRKAAKISSTELAGTECAGGTDVLDRMIQKETVTYLLRALSSNQKRIIVLRDLEGYPMNEISEMLGIKESTIRVHISRARAKMRKIYKRMLKDDI